MQVFEINILRKAGDAWPVVVEISQPDLFLPVRLESVLRLALDELQVQPTPQAYGTLLGQALFQERIRDAFGASLAAPDGQVRVLLYVEAEELKVLHWERLCAPIAGQWILLSLNQSTPFSLYLPATTDRRFPPLGRPDLRALVVVASPDGLEQYGMTPFDVPATIQTIAAALGPIAYDLLANIPGASGPPTLTAVQAQLLHQPYALVHLVCHGRLDAESGETALFLADENNTLLRVTGTTIIEQLGNLEGARGLPHLAFLAACETAHPDAEAVLGGLAQRLVRELGMPAVIAMTGQVPLDTVQKLTTVFYRQLNLHGEVDRALNAACSLLAEDRDIVVPALYSRLGPRALFSDDLNRPLTNGQLAAGLQRLVAYLAERAPILTARFDPLAQRLQPLLVTDVAALTDSARRERTQTLDDLNSLCTEVLDISFAGLAVGKEPPAYDTRCPFPGLNAFRPEETAFYFGRAALVHQITAQIAYEHFWAVVGPSGCGKSSLVFSGLIPALRSQQPALRVLTLTPGDQPAVRLETVLPNGVISSDTPTLLVVDQFEEIFTHCTDEQERRRFLEQLTAPLADGSAAHSPGLRVVITMRSDFLNNCAPYSALHTLLEAHRTLLDPMSEVEHYSAITQQAAVVGLRFEADLANTMVDDVRGEPGATALLQQALFELWQRRHGRWLKSEEYRASGGVRGSIARLADQFYLSLAPAERIATQALFLRLVRLDAEVAGHDTHRRVRLEELVCAPGEEGWVAALVAKVATARLVVTRADCDSGQKIVEIAHKALITHWPLLRSWIQADRPGLLARQALAAAARQWQTNNRRRGDLYRDQRLAQARREAAKNAAQINLVEQEFLRASIRNNRLEHTLRWGLAGVGIIVVALWLYGMATERGPFAPYLVVEAVQRFAAGEVSDILWLDDETIWVGVSEPGGVTYISRSDDAGVTWADQPIPGSFVNALAADPGEPQRLYALVQDAGLLRSDDGGRQWRVVNLLSDWNCPFDIALAPSGVLYLGTCRGRQGIYTSTDRGETWSPVPNTPEINGLFVHWSKDRLLVGGGSTGLWTYDPQQGWFAWFQGEPISILEAADLGDSLIAGGNGIYLLRPALDPRPISVRQVKSLGRDPLAPTFFLAATKEDQLLWGQLDSRRVWQVADYLADTQPPPLIQVIRAQPGAVATFWVSARNGLYKVRVYHWFEFQRQ